VFERLKWRIVEGEKPGLIEDLELARAKKKPLEIINVDLLAGMAVVGDLFGRGDMQLPFVLQSAETMKAAVAHLEPYMERLDGESRGKIVLATVRGDVHDIGKNLVDIILTNNGYTVYNLGIKQPIQHILDVAHEAKPHAIGMSGLLVKSTVIMRENLEEMNRRGVSIPVILGGAALTRAYVEDDCRRIYNGPLYYAEDAFEGLAVMGRIVDGEAKPAPRAAGERRTKTSAASGVLVSVSDDGANGRDKRSDSRVGVESERVAASSTFGAKSSSISAAERSAAAKLDERAAAAKLDELVTLDGAGATQLGEPIGTAADDRASAAKSDEHVSAAASDRAAAQLDPSIAAQRAAHFAAGVASSVPGRIDRPAPMSSKAWSKKSVLPRDIDYPTPPFLGPRIIEAINLQSVMPYINETTLFQFQWGYRRKGKAVAPYKKFIAEHVRPIYHSLAKQCAQEKILEPRAAYGYWHCVPEGDTLVLLDPKNESKEVARFTFPRQHEKQHRCITDFFSVHEGKPDVVALQVVTVGQHASDVAREWFAADRYQDYLHLHGLSVETAEGLSEYLHRQIRGELGIARDDAREMKDLFKQGYRGSRFSFGYPACPNLEDQAILLELLGAKKIGIEMSDEFQLVPEQSTSAIVCHHPSAKYFTI
jgi:cobalamin-dependent methionine synthase I